MLSYDNSIFNISASIFSILRYLKIASFDNVDYIEPALAWVHVNVFISLHSQIWFLGGKLVILDIMHHINQSVHKIKSLREYWAKSYAAGWTLPAAT